MLGHLGASRGHLGAILAPIWAHLGPCGTDRGRTWRHAGDKQGQMAIMYENIQKPIGKPRFLAQKGWVKSAGSRRPAECAGPVEGV